MVKKSAKKRVLSEVINDPRMLEPPRIVRVPIEELDLLQRDPAGYLTRKGATPLSTAYPFFDNREAVRNAFTPQLINHIDDATYQLVDLGRMRVPLSPRFIHIDLSLTKDAAAIACVHPELLRGHEHPLFVCDFMARFVPTPDRPIDLDKIERIVLALQEFGAHVALVTLDGYQSSHMMQHFEAMGLLTGHLSLDRTSMRIEIGTGEVRRVSTNQDYMAPFGVLRQLFTDERLLLPIYYPLIVHYNEAGELIDVPRDALQASSRTWLENELCSLQVDPIKHVVVKPAGGSDDLAQVVAGAVYNCVVNTVHAASAAALTKQDATDKYIEDLHYEHLAATQRDALPTQRHEPKSSSTSDLPLLPEDDFYANTEGDDGY